MAIPPESIDTPEIVWATADETLEQVRDKLNSPRIKNKWRAFVLVRSVDGRYAATSVFDIQELVRSEGESSLSRPLKELGLFHLHSGVEQESIDDLQAHKLADQFGGYLVVLRGGGYVGVVSGASKVGYGLQGPDDYDFLDELLPRSALEEIDFVVATAGTPVTTIARELKELERAQSSCVIVEMDDGSFRVMLASDLDAEVAGGDPQVWLAPLSRFPHILRTAISREFGTVGQEQARNLGEEHGFLILTEGGKPAGLLVSEDVMRVAGPESVPYTKEEGPPYNLFEIPRSLLDDLEATARDEAGARFVNIWFADSSGQIRARNRPLVLRNAYALMLNIGELYEESIIQGLQPPIQEPPVEAPEGTNLYVALFWDKNEFDIPNPIQPLWLPPAGDSPCVAFEVTPLRPSLGPEDKLSLDVNIYYQCSVVQSWRVRVEAVPSGRDSQSEMPQEPLLLVNRTQDYVALEDIGPRHLSLTIDRAPGGGYWFDFVVAQNGAADKVQLSCRVDLRREDLTHLITKARRQLYNVTRARVYREEGVEDEPTKRKALSALALLGRQVYHRLFELEGEDSASGQVGKWITNNLVSGSTLQIIDRARDFVFPWSLVYDQVPWDRSGLTQDVKVDGFWGYRYKIELLTEDLMNTHMDKGIAVEAPEGLQVGVGLNTQIPWSEKQQGFFEDLDVRCGGLASYFFLEESGQLTEFLEDGNQHLFYAFCHGFTERMATDIQIGDNLISEAQAWWNTLPPEQHARFKDQEDDLFIVSDSWIKLTYGTVPLTMMEHYAAAKLAFAPIVFLNMCESAQVLPSLSGGFIPFFLRHGARAVIGTECPMTATFADPFARSFFQRFLEGQSLGQILWELRRDCLDVGNPLGLAYTLYGDAGTKLSKVILQLGGRETSMTNEALEKQVDRLWLQSEEDLYTTLGINRQAVETAKANNDTAKLKRAEHYDTMFRAEDTEMGVLEDLKEFGKRWWKELEPDVYDLLCNKKNPQHDEFLDALVEGAKLLAIALAPALVAQAAALPAVAIVIATIAAKKIADAGLEAACKCWKESMEAPEEA